MFVYTVSVHTNGLSCYMAFWRYVAYDRSQQTQLFVVSFRSCVRSNPNPDWRRTVQAQISSCDVRKRSFPDARVRSEGIHGAQQSREAFRALPGPPKRLPDQPPRPTAHIFRTFSYELCVRYHLLTKILNLCGVGSSASCCHAAAMIPLTFHFFFAGTLPALLSSSR